MAVRGRVPSCMKLVPETVLSMRNCSTFGSIVRLIKADPYDQLSNFPEQLTPGLVIV